MGKVTAYVSLEETELKILKDAMLEGRYGGMRINISDFASSLNCSRNAIYQYINGKTPVPTKVLLAIYRTLHAPPELNFIEQYLSPYEFSYDKKQIEEIKREVRSSAERLEKIIETSTSESRDRILEDLRDLVKKYSPQD